MPSALTHAPDSRTSRWGDAPAPVTGGGTDQLRSGLEPMAATSAFPAGPA